MATTTAPQGLIDARKLLLLHLDMHPGKVVSADLDPAEVGIVGDTRHKEGGDSYHLGRPNLRANAGYSVRESARDMAGLSDHASALDVGWFDVQVKGKRWTLRDFSLWLVGLCRGGDPLTADIREVIYSPDGKTVKRWDRLGKRTTGDASHLTHTHISEHRDARGRRMVALVTAWLRHIGILEDDMPSAKDFVDELLSRKLGDPMESGKSHTVGDYIRYGRMDTRREVAPVLAALGVLDDQVIAGVLGALSPEALASALAAAGFTPQALAAAIPAHLAGQVVDELSRRLSAAPAAE